MSKYNFPEFIDDDKSSGPKYSKEDPDFYSEDSTTSNTEESSVKFQSEEVDLPKPGFGNAGKARTTQNAEEQIQEALEASQDQLIFPPDLEDEKDADLQTGEEADDGIHPL